MVYKDKSIQGKGSQPWRLTLHGEGRRRVRGASRPCIECLEPRTMLTVTPANWMSTIADSTLLSKMSIPGTHDTMTYETYLPWTRTQDTSLMQQLDDGIRYLDIRLGGLQVGSGISHGNLGVYHGSIYLDATFLTTVIATCQTFLAENPSETIIMSIKDEHANGLTNNQFARIADTIMKNSQKAGEAHNEPLFYTGTSVPELGTVRGQIVLLRRYPDPHKEGINASSWSVNPATPFAMSATFAGHGPGSIIVEDHYEPAGGFLDNPLYNYEALKEENIETLLSEANAEPAGQYNWYIAFTSATDLTSGPRGFASYEDAALQTYLATVQGLVGTIVMDFPSDELIQEIINHNDD
jgi:1-phosphatidylinositol phosphodiesterase